MSRIGNNNEAWIRLMLDDEKMLKEMGLPDHLTEDEKEFIINHIMDSNRLQEDFKFEESIKPDNMSPSEWLVSQILNDNPTEKVVGDSVDPSDLIVGNFYLIIFPNGKEAEVKLNRILPNSLGNDYIFENIIGAESLIEKSTSSFIRENEFPLPEQLLAVTKFKKIKYL